MMFFMTGVLFCENVDRFMLLNASGLITLSAMDYLVDVAETYNKMLSRIRENETQT